MPPPPPTARRATRPRTVRDAMAAAAALGVPPDRVLVDPPPGRATEAGLVKLNDAGVFCELLDKTFLEKPVGAPESHLANRLAGLIEAYLTRNDLGYTYGESAMVRFAPGVVLGPDLCFVAWSRTPAGTVPTDPVAGVIPNLVVEVLSPGNTKAEMDRKRAEYFKAGVELAWFIDPAARTAEAYTSPAAVTPVPVGGALDGGTVLPGPSVPLATLFARLPAPPAKPARKPRPRRKP